MKLLFLLGMVLGASCSLTPDANADLITDLPGLDFKINFQQFSGYLKGNEKTFLHYWFVESENKPSEDPLLLWLNGGPGCSSLDGLLSELGPIHVKLEQNDSFSLYKNEYAWNKYANVLFLESPACVGFSYSTDEENPCKASDDSTSLINYHAILDFFKKFPAYLKNDFFITGESYGGVYIPTLTKRIVDGMADNPLKLSGFAIGNGITSWALNTESIMFFAYYHGLVGEAFWNNMVGECCTDGVPDKESCSFSSPETQACSDAVDTVSNIIYNSGLNMYNLYGVCENSSEASGVSRYQVDVANSFRQITKEELELTPPCVNVKNVNTFLNDPAVRAALHIPESVQKWELCSDKLNYERDYDEMSAFYFALQKAGVRGMLYNGDVDMACNFLMNEWFVESLGFTVTEERRMWHAGGQVAGFVKRFEGLDLVTVRGAGHMVPQNKPIAALHMLESFIKNIDY